MYYLHDLVQFYLLMYGIDSNEVEIAMMMANITPPRKGHGADMNMCRSTFLWCNLVLFSENLAPFPKRAPLL
jgi:hypothetical protein